MEKYLFAPLLVTKLASDECFRMLFARLLAVLATLITITSVILFFLGWKEIFDMSSEAMVGGIVFQLAFALAAYQAVHTTLVRSVEVKRESGRPAAIAVAAAILRLVGEVFGFAAAILGVGGGILVWFAGREAAALLDRVALLFPFLKAGPASFLGGATLLVQGLGYGTLALLFGYLLAGLLPLPSGGARTQVAAEEV
jgi:hypothetical protein